MRLVSLFAGIGGFDLGFERAGFEIVGHCEICANCRKLLAARWPEAVCVEDVRAAGRHNLPDCDIVTFGFPCQDLSVAGKREGLGGERSGLFYEAMRIIDELQPAWALWENVPGLLSSDDGRDLARVLFRLGKSGYFGCVRCLDAQWLGVAQRRRRLFGLFTRLDSGAERCAKILSVSESLRGHPPPRREAREGASHGIAPCIGASGRGFERAGESRGQDPVVAVQDVPTTAHTLRAEADASEDGTGRGTPLIPAVADPLPVALSERTRGDGSVLEVEREPIMPALKTGTQRQQAVAVSVYQYNGALSDAQPTLGSNCGVSTGRNGVMAFAPNTRDEVREMEVCGALAAEPGMKQTSYLRHAMSVRRLTPTECERLQGFPDGWTAGFSDSTRYKMLGNAVCVNVAEWIARRMMEREAEGTIEQTHE